MCHWILCISRILLDFHIIGAPAHIREHCWIYVVYPMCLGTVHAACPDALVYSIYDAAQELTWFFYESFSYAYRVSLSTRHNSYINIIYIVHTEWLLFICILCKHIRWPARYVACSQCWCTLMCNVFAVVSTCSACACESAQRWDDTY